VEITLEEALTRGVAAQKEGRLQDAEHLFKAILRARPDHADANYHLGLLAVSVSKFDIASQFFKKAIDSSPNSTPYWINYVEALIEGGQVSRAQDAIVAIDGFGVVSERLKTLKARVESLSSEPSLPFTNQRKKRTQAKRRKKRSRQRNRGESPTDKEISNLMTLYQNNQLHEAETVARSLAARYAQHPFSWKVLGAALRQLGKVQEALTAMKTSAQLAPSDAEAQNNLGSTFLELGRLEEAESSCMKAIDLRPNYPEAFFNLGLVLQQSNRLEEAEKAHNQAISLRPEYAEAHYNKGITQQTLGRSADAEESYKRALVLQPGLVGALNNIGLIRQKAGDLNDAVHHYRQAIAINTEYSEAHNNLGTALKEMGRLRDAENSFRNAISLNPHYAESLNNLGVVLQELERFEEAEKISSRALELKPNYIDAHINKGSALQRAGKFEEATSSYANALSLDEDNPKAYCYMGSSLRALGRLEEAKACYLKSITLDPYDAETQNNLGVTLQELGEINEAKERYKEAISINPIFAEAHRYLAGIKKYNFKDDQFLKMEEICQREEMTADELCHIHFGLAKACEDLEDSEQAFLHYSRGNALRREILDYDIEQDMKLFDRIKRAHPQIEKLSIGNDASTATLIPIFIIGMPRSGTTLIEQIISAHPLVTGGGELPFVTEFGGSIASALSSINEASVRDFREQYLEQAKIQANGNSYVTDKMPMNFRFAGLIAAALPESKIIHVKRDSRATCWSNFKHYFASDDIGYCYSLRDVVSYFKHYEALMRYWDRALQKKIYHLDYDSLTANQDPETRRVIDYLGLDWSDMCLSPHKNLRKVATASNIQVRQEGYRGSSLQWEKYRPFLENAFDDLT
jgi:tetratricopeptide (TPR) repeat protein